MTHKPIYCAGVTPAIQYAELYLQQAGMWAAPQPRWDTGHLLLDVPSFRPEMDPGRLDTLLSSLPRDVTVWGGNLEHPSLDGYKKVDLLKDEEYLCENAAITADCAVDVAAPLLNRPWDETPALVIGWGRIGKCLGTLLRSMDCPVTVAARSERDLNALKAQGYRTADTGDLTGILPEFRLIFNTVPAAVISEEAAALCKDCVKIDLASKKGIGGSDVIWARGLPGKYAPERSGQLIADSVLRLLKEEIL